MNGNERGPGNTNGPDLTTCSLAKFAAAVHRAIALIGNDERDRYGARKVFVSAIFRQLARAGHDVGSLDSFKARLVSANCAGLLSLARADLVGAMPRMTVAASEIAHLGSTFHFVVDASARDPWELAS